MRSWVLLLLLSALSAARLRLGSAEGDPLPPSLVDLVRNSPISSVDELKVLLLQEANAIEEEEDEHDFLTNHTHGRYSRSLVEAQQAQLANCKVRTEVMEVTRSMLDRRNADFILWPPCVEVQRCSGCCNARHLQCIPTVTSSRYLKVLKIQVIKGQPHYTYAMISVEDHVSCRCQPATSSSSSSSSSSLPVANSPVQSSPNPPPPPPQQPASSSHLPLPLPRSVHPAPPKSHASKADLHRHDVLKHNQQRYHSEEREPVARQWQQGSYTQLVHWTQPRVHQGPAHQPIAGVLGSVSSWPSEARAEHSVMGSTQQVGHGSGFEGSREEGSVASNTEGHHPDHAQRQQQVLQHQQRQQHQQPHLHHRQPHYPQPYNHGGAEDPELRTQHRLNAPQSDSALPPVSPTLPPASEQNPTLPLTTNQRDSVTSQIITQVTKQTETETVSQGSEREESGSANSGDSAGAEPANQGRERDSKLTTEDGHLTEEEERRHKLLEMVQSEPDKQTHLHPHPPQQRPKPTTFITVVSTVAPMSPAARQAPFRPASPRRRRKHRKRISKAALRAMIM
ncbi:ell-associated factor Eaf isoform X5 [Hippoglossus hippoglossus]|uniref:ell-associated factor Eaf isoform X5 n=1 Tax=Hippoglossus hippoglossus TaxID=8267 RepID=UPI00148E41A3|nr:ell-associated factor Eaf isoform X5 [Hippoglossus hippoglossus]